MFLIFFLLAIIGGGSSVDADDYFGIQVVDSQTGRGVPLVELSSTNHIVWVTDSAGWIAIQEPELMERQVFFHVESHGYHVAADGFGNRGVRLNTSAGRRATIQIERDNIAERVCRLTGEGIFRDSELLGQRPISRQPRGGVLGQDTVQAALFQGRVFWFWGDTSRSEYPLGNFKTSGATSSIPDPKRGLDASDSAIEFEYFVDDRGFSRPMAPIEGPGAVWLHGLLVLSEPAGESMFAHFARVKSLGEVYEQGLVEFDRQSETFVKRSEWKTTPRLYPRGQSLNHASEGVDRVYFATPFPFIRVAASRDAVLNPDQYEAFTCLAPATSFAQDESVVERDAEGHVVWGWKPHTDSMNPQRENELIRYGLLPPEERRCGLRAGNQMLDIALHAGSVHWNDYRRCWIMIAVQAGGEQSYLGDVWYAEADQLEGPWVNAVRILTHDHYSFYNPTAHPFMDQRGGRYIYFEGTYASTFSRAKYPTPRYDYNQILYRLDLDDPRMPKARSRLDD